LAARLPGGSYVFSVLAAQATERGLLSAGMLVSEGGFGILRARCAVLTFLRDKSRAPCRDPGWGAKQVSRQAGHQQALQRNKFRAPKIVANQAAFFILIVGFVFMVQWGVIRAVLN